MRYRKHSAAFQSFPLKPIIVGSLRLWYHNTEQSGLIFAGRVRCHDSICTVQYDTDTKPLLGVALGMLSVVGAEWSQVDREIHYDMALCLL